MGHRLCMTSLQGVVTRLDDGRDTIPFLQVKEQVTALADGGLRLQWLQNILRHDLTLIR